MSLNSTKKDKGEWGSAKDPKSGRVYYYNIRTKETTWNKVIQSLRAMFSSFPTVYLFMIPNVAIGACQPTRTRGNVEKKG